MRRPGALAFALAFLLSASSPAFSAPDAGAPRTAADGGAAPDPETRRQQLIDAYEGVNKEIDSGAGLAGRDSVGSMAMGFLRSMFALLVVCGLAYLLLGKVLPRLLRLSPTARRSPMATQPMGIVEVVDRLPLDAKRMLLLVEVEGRRFLVGASENRFDALGQVDAAPPEGRDDEPSA